MSEGLYLVQISITYYRALTIVGWLRRVRGDEYELAPGARIVTRAPGEAASWTGLDDLAASGPGERYTLHAAMTQPEPLHRLMIKRAKPCDESAWAQHCPRPADWSPR